MFQINFVLRAAIAAIMEHEGEEHHDDRRHDRWHKPNGVPVVFDRGVRRCEMIDDTS